MILSHANQIVLFIVAGTSNNTIRYLVGKLLSLVNTCVSGRKEESGE